MSNAKTKIQDLMAKYMKKHYGKEEYQEKPEGVRTLLTWLKKEKMPISEDVIKTYNIPTDKEFAYNYIHENDVRDMTEEEKKAWSEIETERRQTSKEKRTTKQTKKDTKPTTNKRNRRPTYNKAYLPDFEALKGKRILCFDTETTGFSPAKGDELLQASFVWRNPVTQQETEWSQYMKPHHKKSWPGAEAKNHISPDMVKRAKYPEDYKDEIQTLINHSDVIVAYNADFDIRFLKECMEIDFTGKTIVDPMVYFKHTEPNNPKHTLTDCMEHYMPDKAKEFTKQAHNAIYDTRAAMDCLYAQAESVGYDLNEPSDFQKIYQFLIEQTNPKLAEDVMCLLAKHLNESWTEANDSDTAEAHFNRMCRVHGIRMKDTLPALKQWEIHLKEEQKTQQDAKWEEHVNQRAAETAADPDIPQEQPDTELEASM